MQRVIALFRYQTFKIISSEKWQNLAWDLAILAIGPWSFHRLRWHRILLLTSFTLADEVIEGPNTWHSIKKSRMVRHAVLLWVIIGMEIQVGSMASSPGRPTPGALNILSRGSTSANLNVYHLHWLQTSQYWLYYGLPCGPVQYPEAYVTRMCVP